MAGRISTRWRVLILAGLLLTSVGANVFLADQLATSFKKLQLLRVFPIGSDTERSAVPGPVGGDSTSVVVVGDSRAAMWATEPLSQAGWEVSKEAVGGFTSEQMRLRLLEQDSPSTEWAVLQIGINDLHPLDLFPEQHEQIVDQLKRNLRTIVGHYRDAGSKVVLTTLFPRDAVPLQRRPFWGPATDEAIDSINAFIRQTAASEGLPLIDANELLADEAGLLRSEYVDRAFFLHASPAAYGVLNTSLLSILGPAR